MGEPPADEVELVDGEWWSSPPTCHASSSSSSCEAAGEATRKELAPRHVAQHRRRPPATRRPRGGADGAAGDTRRSAPATAGTCTDSGIYLPDWADLEDLPPGAIIENPARRPIGIDLFAGAGGFSCGFKQAGWHVIAANEHDACAAYTYLCNLGSPRTRIVFCTPEDEERWHRARKRLERYHADPDRPSLQPGSGWIAGQTGVQPCEVFFFGDVRHLTGRRILAELGRHGDEIGCVFGGPPCQGSRGPANARPMTRATSWCSSSCAWSARSTLAVS